MPTFVPSVIIDEVKNLLTYSCSQLNEKDSPFLSLHKGLVKLYFEARNVEIDYVNQKMKVEIPINKKEYTTICFDCQDLERFLKSCLRSDKRSLVYYQNVLSYYNFMKEAS